MAVPVGGYTYVRNALFAGNPVYPQPVSLLGWELPGVSWLSLATRLEAPEAKIDLWELLTGRPEFLFGLFRWTIVPAALLGPCVALVRRRWLTALVLALPVVLFLQFLYLMHDHREVRYLLAALALGAVAAGWLIDLIGRLAPGVRWVIALVAFVRWYQAPKAPGVVEALLALLAASAVLVSSEAWRRRRREWGRRGWVAALVVAGGALVALSRGVDYYQERKLEPHWAAAALDSATGKSGAVIAYTGYNQPYLYFGSRLQNEVRIVPRNRDLLAEHYRWGGTARWPYERGSYRAWLANLRRLGVRYVVVALELENGGLERRWMRRQRREFELVHSDPITEVWRLREPVSRPRTPPARRLRRASPTG